VKSVELDLAETRTVAGRAEFVMVDEFAVWVPILWLVAILAGGYLFGIFGGLVLLVAATIYVYYNSKKFGVKGSRWLLTLILAIVGLPLYAYELHKLRKTQIAHRQTTLVEPALRPATASIQEQAPIMTERSTVIPSMKFCRFCGAKIPRDSKFCEECGAKVEA